MRRCKKEGEGEREGERERGRERKGERRGERVVKEAALALVVNDKDK